MHMSSSIQGVKEAERTDVAVHSIIIGTTQDSILITNVHLPYKGDKRSAEKRDTHWQAVRTQWGTREERCRDLTPPRLPRSPQKRDQEGHTQDAQEHRVKKRPANRRGKGTGGRD